MANLFPLGSALKSNFSFVFKIYSNLCGQKWRTGQGSSGQDETVLKGHGKLEQPMYFLYNL